MDELSDRAKGGKGKGGGKGDKGKGLAAPVLGPSAAQSNHDPGPRPNPLASASAQSPQAGQSMPGERPQIHGAVDSVMGAPLTPPTGKPLPAAGASTPAYAESDKHFESLSLDVDSQGGAAVPRELDGHKKRKGRS